MADYSEAKVRYDGEDRLERKIQVRGESVPSDTIGGRINQIQEYLMFTDEVLSKVEAQLEPLLAPEYDGSSPPRSEGDSSPERTQSDIAEQLESYANRIDRINSRLQRISRRINL